MIYFIGTGVHVKIGYAEDERTVRLRLQTLQNGNPLTLAVLMLMPGTIDTEVDLHLLHKDLHVRGEWFRAEGALGWCAFATPPAHSWTVEDVSLEEG